jgi:biopolymer transport protein TolQ
MILPSLSLLAQLPSTPARDAGPGLLEFFMRSGPMAKLVLLTLVLFSLLSWTVMLGKYFQTRRAASHTRKFLEIFHQSKRFSEVNASAGKLYASPLVGLFQAGYAEIDAQVKSLQEAAGSTAAGATGRYRIRSLVGVERSLRRAMGAELQLLAKGTHFLATTAAATPFIGLFGTVWGIMIAFNDIGRTGSTSIVAVAPGIAEALINTAAGLVAAIPALIGYNYFGNRLRRLRGEMEDFALEFLNLAERNFT